MKSFPMKGSSEENQEKRQTIDRLLSGDHVLVHLDPSQEQVVLPNHLMSDSSVTLKLSYLFNGMTVLEENSIEAELRFSGQYFSCVMPYNAIWGVTDEHGKSTIWPSSAPKEVLKELLDAQVERSQPKSSLAEVSPDKDSDFQEAQRPLLRRVK